MNYRKLSKYLAVFFVSGTAAWAQSLYTFGHGDVGIGYDAVLQEFDPHWHLHSGAIVDGVPIVADEEYAAGDLLAVTTATRTSPNGLSGILGLADGSPMFVMGDPSYQPYTGFAVEELSPSDWSGDITISLSSWVVPVGGAYALYTTNITGTNVVDRLFSTLNPGQTEFGNSFTLMPGEHAHFEWGFSQPGTYELTFQWSGTHVTDGLITTSETFTVQVVPEPSAVALTLLGLAAAWAVRRRN